ncbi:hypothetical protein T440DRAFT_503584 [Plenodomus tracheiphilus IPT5]|uniref:MARVEL domain-containing protein n=1 Tax=Plenodomus tracheiphilus IPT5 TaxID=1408161 RepID=A0A6A7BQN0_9PLEO|nr:hypothetical protein T440DRAFT_503584 [Plenodomus tracheiphilus IPT5]
MTRATHPVPLIIGRAFQILFSLVVLGITISLIQGHKSGPIPSALAFAVIIGAVSLVGGILNLASSFLEFLHDQLTLIIDGVVLLSNATGGIWIAMKMKGVQCKFDLKYTGLQEWDMGTNDIVCGGKIKVIEENQVECYYYQEDDATMLNRRCREGTAVAAFMFLTAVTMIGIAAVAFRRMRNPYGARG